jgi:hypothetical protein
MRARSAGAESVPSGNCPVRAGPAGHRIPDLASYDRIVVSISGGKDSQVALHRTALAACAAGVADPGDDGVR